MIDLLKTALKAVLDAIPWKKIWHSTVDQKAEFYATLFVPFIVGILAIVLSVWSSPIPQYEGVISVAVVKTVLEVGREQQARKDAGMLLVVESGSGSMSLNFQAESLQQIWTNLDEELLEVNRRALELTPGLLRLDQSLLEGSVHPLVLFAEGEPSGRLHAGRKSFSLDSFRLISQRSWSTSYLSLLTIVMSLGVSVGSSKFLEQMASQESS